MKRETPNLIVCALIIWALFIGGCATGGESTGPENGAACGNGVVEGVEECDDGDANSDTEPDACRTNCRLPWCGDGVVDSGEECDPPDGINCNADCRWIREDCGNGMVDPGEDCDGEDLAGATCESLGFDGGQLSCDSNCAFNTSSCYKCGDGVISGSEDCDGENLDGQTCQNLGFDGGELSCSEDCTFNTSACFVCGNGVKEEDEECDGSDLGGNTCQGLGFDGGDLICKSDCTLDTSGCHLCGDGICEPPEEDTCNCPEDCGSLCGDGCCNGNEDSTNCPEDCGTVCGDGVCNGDENSINCPEDCGDECGDGVCGPTENYCNCSADCPQPLVTDWNTGTWEGWTPAGSNWLISSGTPWSDNHARFSFSPTATYYTMTLTSPVIDLAGCAIADMDFDFAFSDWDGTGSNNLFVECSTNGSSWVSVGGFNTWYQSWGNHSAAKVTSFLDPCANSSTVWVRFRVTGNDSWGINYYAFNNVSVW